MEKTTTPHLLFPGHSRSLHWDVKRVLGPLRDPWPLCLRGYQCCRLLVLASPPSALLSFTETETGELYSPSFPANAPALHVGFFCASHGNLGTWGLQGCVQVRILWVGTPNVGQCVSKIAAHCSCTEIEQCVLLPVWSETWLQPRPAGFLSLGTDLWGWWGEVGQWLSHISFWYKSAGT